MARTRNLKPSFFLNEQLAEVAPLGRLLFEGLWCHSDREGRIEDRPKRLKAEILPYDECDADALLNELHKRQFILRYSIGDVKYIQVVTFRKHQDPHYKEVASVIPPPHGHIDSGRTPGGVPDEVRQAVFDRDGRKCRLCGSPDDLSLDHVISRSKGGSHEEDNLQTLCRRCNAGKNNRQAKADLEEPSANDGPMIGLSLADDRPTSLDPGSSIQILDQDPGSVNPLKQTSVPRSTIQGCTSPAATRAGARAHGRAKANGAAKVNGAKGAETWACYARAYEVRWGVQPTRNAGVNTRLARLVDKLGPAEAPQVAAFFLTHNRAMYVASKHCTELLLRDAEGLRTEWVTGQRITTTQANTVDRLQTSLDVVDRVAKRIGAT